MNEAQPLFQVKLLTDDIFLTVKWRQRSECPIGVGVGWGCYWQLFWRENKKKWQSSLSDMTITLFHACK